MRVLITIFCKRSIFHEFIFNFVLVRLLCRRHRRSQDLERNEKNRIQERKTGRCQNVSPGKHLRMHVYVNYKRNLLSPNPLKKNFHYISSPLPADSLLNWVNSVLLNYLTRKVLNLLLFREALLSFCNIDIVSNLKLEIHKIRNQFVYLLQYMSFSAHADAKGIMQLISHCCPANVMLVHGEAVKMEFLKVRKKILSI